jgi:hypothetical protein
MKCESITDKIDDYLDGELASEEQKAMARHLETCAACRQDVESARALLDQLSDLNVPAPRPGYEDRVLQFLQEERKQKVHRPRAMPIWFATGFATAALAIFGVLFMTNSPVFNPAEPMPVMTVELQPMQARKVSLVFNSPVEIQDASLRIELPEGTEIAGYPNTSSLEWKTSLKQGSNRLSLPLIIKGKKGGTLYAKISHSGTTRVFKLNVVSLPASSNYPVTVAS